MYLRTIPRSVRSRRIPDAVARAIADQSGYRLQPTPARAANALGLSSQVPAPQSRRGKTVSKLFALELLGLALSEKQVPQIVETISSVES